MIHALVGTRAQLIKMAPVLREIERRGLPLNLVFTGQHQVTMRELLADFGVRATPRRLHEGREIGGLLQMGVWLLRCLAKLLWNRRDWFGSGRGVVLVHGDTMSTLLGALAGRLLGIPVAHVEAGLRSFDWRNPFPEELTRLAVFRLADVAYAPGAWAAGNLRGYRLQVIDTGQNTLLDALRLALEGAPAQAGGAPYFVASLHRFENLSSPARWQAILRILEALSTRARCVFVLHPVTEARLRRSGDYERLAANPAFELAPRMTYRPFVALLAGAKFVVTDGGSNQEELSYLGIPTVLMREATERQEGLGANVLLGNYDLARVCAFLDATPAAPPRLPEASPSNLIVDDLARRLEA